jgi:hypothetical protein
LDLLGDTWTRLVITSSQGDVVRMWKLMDTLPPCPFKQLLHNNRGSGGWKIKNKSIVLDTKRTFEQLHKSVFLKLDNMFLIFMGADYNVLILLFH